MAQFDGEGDCSTHQLAPVNSALTHPRVASIPWLNIARMALGPETQFGEQVCRQQCFCPKCSVAATRRVSDGRAHSGRMGIMADCIHGLEEDQRGTCGTRALSADRREGTMAGKTFALVFAPALRGDTFLHFNREGDHWKFRWYSSPGRLPTELAQSGKASHGSSLTSPMWSSYTRSRTRTRRAPTGFRSRTSDTGTTRSPS